MKRVPYKYDWVSGERFRWLGWILPRINKKSIITSTYVRGYDYNIILNAAFYNQSPEEYLAQLYDEGWLTGQAEKDIIWIVTTNQNYRSLIEAEIKNKMEG